MQHHTCQCVAIFDCEGPSAWLNRQTNRPRTERGRRRQRGRKRKDEEIEREREIDSER